MSRGCELAEARGQQLGAGVLSDPRPRHQHPAQRALPRLPRPHRVGTPPPLLRLQPQQSLQQGVAASAPSPRPWLPLSSGPRPPPGPCEGRPGGEDGGRGRVGAGGWDRDVLLAHVLDLLAALLLVPGLLHLRVRIIIYLRLFKFTYIYNYIFGCESSPISRNVRSLVRQLVSP